jgi:DNA-binding beta-propeller fold protein YncE
VKEASGSSQSFSDSHKRFSGLEIGAILLFICGFFLSLSVIVFLTGILNHDDFMWSFFAVVLLSILFISIVWGIRKFQRLGYVFDLPVVYTKVFRKSIELRNNPRELVFNEGNNKLYIATKNSIVVFDDSINRIIDEILIKNPYSMAVDHTNDKLFATLDRGIAVIDTSSNTLIKNIFEDFRFSQLCININTNMLYTINVDLNCVYIIECSSHALVDKIYCIGYPRIITLNQNTNSIYIGNSDFVIMIVDGSKNQEISRIHLANPPERWYGSSKTLDGLYVDPSNNLLYVKEDVTTPNEGGASLGTLFFKLHLNSIRHSEYFMHDYECDIIPKTERYMPDHKSGSILRKHDILSRTGSLDNSFVVNSKSGLQYLTDMWSKKLEEIDTNNKILRTFKIDHEYVSMTINPNGNKLYLANSGYFSNWLDIIYLPEEPTVNPPVSIESSSR